MKELNVHVSLKDEIKADDLRIKDADVVICATGSHAFLPPIEGLNNAYTAVDVLKGEKHIDKHAVITGGGLVGCELAIWLAQQGKKTTIVEMADKLMSTGAPADMNIQMIMELLEHYHTDIHLNAKLTKVEEGKIFVNENGETKEIEAPSVIIALGYRSENSLYHNIMTIAKDIYNIGDSSHPKDIMEGIWDAYELCSHL